MSVSRPPHGREPAFNIPAIVLGFVAALAGVHAARGLLDEEATVRMLLELAFFPAPWSIATGWTTGDDVIRAAGAAVTDAADAGGRVALARFVVEQGVRPWSGLTYALLHGSWTHLVLNGVWLVAFGTNVARRAGAVRFGVLAVATALGGAIAQGLSDPLGVQPMIGASAIVSGFMGAAATFIFRRPAGFGTPRAATRWSFMSNRNALGFLGIWLVVNLVFGAAAVPLGVSDAAIAWEAHVGGLLVGLVLFPLIDPGAARSPPTLRTT